MLRRAEQVDQTRLRITEAAVRLHTTIGPANTTLSAVADEAGVTRLTVYRHFVDQDELFAACSRHWTAQHPRPDPDRWLEIEDLDARARRGFAELYHWFGDNGDDLYPIYRDLAAMPRSTQEAITGTYARMADALLDGHVPPDLDGRVFRAVAGHLVSFWTWRSLVVERGLALDEASNLAVRFLLLSRGATTIDGSKSAVRPRSTAGTTRRRAGPA